MPRFRLLKPRNAVVSSNSNTSSTSSERDIKLKNYFRYNTFIWFRELSQARLVDGQNHSHIFSHELPHSCRHHGDDDDGETTALSDDEDDDDLVDSPFVEPNPPSSSTVPMLKSGGLNRKKRTTVSTPSTSSSPLFTKRAILPFDNKPASTPLRLKDGKMHGSSGSGDGRAGLQNSKENVVKGRGADVRKRNFRRSNAIKSSSIQFCRSTPRVLQE